MTDKPQTSEIPGWAWERAYRKHIREINAILKDAGKTDWIEAQKYAIQELRREARRVAREGKQ